MKLKYALLLSAISLTLTACGGSSNDNPKPPIVVADTTPDSFSFSAIENAPLNKWVESAPVTITGINTDTPISIENGEYSIDGAPFTVSPGYVTLNQTVVIRVKSHKNSLSEVTAIINVGNISKSFQVTTEARLVFMGWDEQFGNELRTTNLLKNGASLVQDINVTLANKLEGEKIKSPVKFGDDLFYCRAETGVEFSDVIYSYNEATKKLISLGSISSLIKQHRHTCVELFELNNQLYVVTDNQETVYHVWQITNPTTPDLTKVGNIDKDYRFSSDFMPANVYFLRAGKLEIKHYEGAYDDEEYSVKNWLDGGSSGVIGSRLYSGEYTLYQGEKDNIAYFTEYLATGLPYKYWRSDGTKEGTYKLSKEDFDLKLGRENVSKFVDGGVLICSSNGFNFYSVKSSHYDLYSYNKITGKNTLVVTDIDPSKTVCNEKYALGKQYNGNDINLWSSKGEGDNTQFLRMNDFSSDIYLTRDTFHFLSEAYVYSTDGNLNNLQRADITADIRDIYETENRLFFSAFDDTDGLELWALNDSQTVVEKITSDSFKVTNSVGTQGFSPYLSSMLDNGTLVIGGNISGRTHALDLFAYSPDKKNNIQLVDNFDKGSWGWWGRYYESHIRGRKLLTTHKYAYFTVPTAESTEALQDYCYRTDGVTYVRVSYYFGCEDGATVNNVYLATYGRDARKSFSLYYDSESVDNVIYRPYGDEEIIKNYSYYDRNIFTTTDEFFYLHAAYYNEGNEGKQHLYKINTEGEINSVFESENIAFGELSYLSSSKNSVYFVHYTENEREVWRYDEESNESVKLFTLMPLIDLKDISIYAVDNVEYVIVSGNTAHAGLYLYNTQFKEKILLASLPGLLNLIEADNMVYVMSNNAVWQLKNETLQLIANKELLSLNDFSISGLKNEITIGNKLIFEANHHLWMTDSTLEGTRVINDKLLVNGEIYLAH